MLLGIDPKVDYAFKFLFGNEKKPQSLIRLLNAILTPPPGEEIVEVEILNPFHEKVAVDNKLSILDIKARDQFGRLFNVEMQMALPPDLRQRILYYWSRLYTDQLQTGDDYALLRPTISVCFVNAVLFRTTPEHHLKFQLVDTGQGVTMTEDLSIHFFELPKFKQEAEEITTPLEAWLYFLKHAETLDTDDLPEPLDTGELREAMEALMELTEIDIQKQIYEERLKAQRDQQMYVNAAARALTEGRAEGLSEGLTQGLTKGVLIGQIEFAQRLLKREATLRAELEAMPLEALKALAAQLEKEVSGEG